MVTISVIVISKNERGLHDTLVALEEQVHSRCQDSDDSIDITVVDASNGMLSHIEKTFPHVRWLNFKTPDGIRVSIPHQRNVGIQTTKGEIIVFIDAGCIPHRDWLRKLIAPIADGSERMTCGPSWVGESVFSSDRGTPSPEYVLEAPTINLAFTRGLSSEVGEFDESFEYGSDIDFTRRVVAQGTRIRFVSDAIVEHDWGSFLRQLKRSRQYGAARIRLAAKQENGVLSQTREEPVPILYALFILGLPIVLRYRTYLLLLGIPLWRARKRPFPLRVVIFHLAEGVGGLQELMSILKKRIFHP
jgi:GT2 family glycosyltransferase